MSVKARQPATIMSNPSTIERFLRDYAGGGYFARLVNAPTPHRLRRPPEITYHATLHGVEPRFTIVTPAFNGAGMIGACIEAAARNASLPFDWILVDDGSDDGTADRARAMVESKPTPLLARATIVRNPAPVFETACDNIGFWLAETEVIIEIQSDIEVREPAFDALVFRALATTPTPSAVSGRCGHSFFGVRGRYARALLGGSRGDCVGLCGSLIETPEVVEPLRGRIYRCETVPRGPWAVLKSDLERVGYLDERHFFLGRDDHDYHRRLFEADGRRPVYAPMSMSSPLEIGTSRLKRSSLNAEVFKDLNAEKRGSREFWRFLRGHWRPSPPELIDW